MDIREGTIITPLPEETLLLDRERKWRVKLPIAYKEFIKKYNGSSPIKDSFLCNKHEYTVDRFLCILQVTGNNENEYYDIGVVKTQLDERIVTDEDLVGTELLPIAVLFAGDFVCLDYRDSTEEPTVCVWNHEESGDLDPVTYFLCDSFTTFLNLLR
ncbi:SMI1/KNR4 family protein [Listeria booriae]|uniref:Cell wall assembly protein n=1 Tax=Listeria booriae TaxID=1552123 RepID=A0A099WCI2_9LIST|nr:SMI1/KNR4 family protein [Listeria booriae]KGL42727.1 cell wall assembly protein [Listeria booriae]MBC1371368.1 SMI1/KNR4 family protein [Listeria booriae]MBC1561427.1 SMI1/KNR4 family protein [Listeria booriae]MBC1906119.1 SMI1/KNR4 family protein [Listeria booriae]MBC1912205.1 SMI1/KNR4 family protein [Listeria booriae]